MIGPLRGEGWARAWPLRNKTFFEAPEKKNSQKNLATKLEGGGGIKALVARALIKIFYMLCFIFYFCQGAWEGIKQFFTPDWTKYTESDSFEVSPERI